MLAPFASCAAPGAGRALADSLGMVGGVALSAQPASMTVTASARYEGRSSMATSGSGGEERGGRPASPAGAASLVERPTRECGIERKTPSHSLDRVRGPAYHRAEELS